MSQIAQPVLSVVVRRFRHEVRDDVEDALETLQRAMSQQTGFIRMQNSVSRGEQLFEIVTVFYFNTRADLEKWWKSSFRRDLVARLDGLSSGGPTLTEFDGLAVLAAPNARVRKIETVAILIFWILLNGSILSAIADILLPASFAPFWRGALIVAVNVFLISYVFLPWSSAGLARLKSRLSGSARREP